MTLVLYEDATRGDKLEIPLPLAFTADIPKMAASLGLPDYLDTTDYQTAKAIAVAWSAQNAPALAAADGKRINREPLPLAFFGGMGFRFHCPSANQKDGPLYRELNDLDLLTLKKHGRALVALLEDLHVHLGTAYGFWLPRPDRMYNGFREGRRYRMTTVNHFSEGKRVPEAGKLDIFTESMTFCHDVPIKNEIAAAHRRNYSLGLESLVLLKTQFIKKVVRQEIPADDFRVLEPYDDTSLIIGMEPKDALDVCAALNDHSLNADVIAETLANDWGLHRTVRLNLGNLAARLEDVLRPRRASDAQIARIREQLEGLINRISSPDASPKKPFFQFRKQWWRTVED